MICAACVKCFLSCKCVLFAVLLRPEPRRFGGAKNLNEINEVNEIALLFGAVFISCSTDMWEIGDEMAAADLTAHKRLIAPLATHVAGHAVAPLAAGI